MTGSIERRAEYLERDFSTEELFRIWEQDLPARKRQLAQANDLYSLVDSIRNSNIRLSTANIRTHLLTKVRFPNQPQLEQRSRSEAYASEWSSLKYLAIVKALELRSGGDTRIRAGFVRGTEKEQALGHEIRLVLRIDDGSPDGYYTETGFDQKDMLSVIPKDELLKLIGQPDKVERHESRRHFGSPPRI